MSGYLQRLLDRAAPAPPAAALIPAGLSHSPISLADQRLNDSDFADRQIMPPVPEPDDTTDVPVTVMPQPAQRHVTPVSDFAVPARQPVVAIANHEADISQAPPIMAAEPEPLFTPSPHPNPVGLVTPEDLVLDEPEIQEQKTIKSAPAETVTAQTPPQTDIDLPMPEPPIPVPQSTKPDVPSDPPVQRHEPARPASPPAEPVPAVPDLDDPAPKASADAPTVAEQKPPTDLFPPPVIAPAPPDSPVFGPRQSEPHPASPATANSPEPPEPIQTAPSERRNRPMTAAEVSLIGPLHRRRRALTLFGLRRR